MSETLTTLNVEMTGNAENFVKETKKVEKKIEDLDKSTKTSFKKMNTDSNTVKSGIGNLTSSFSQLSSIMAGIGVTAGIAKFLSYTMQISSEIGDIVDKSRLLGESFQNTKYLGNIAETSGIGEDKISDIYKKMLLNFQSGKLDEPFKKLNIEVSKFGQSNMVDRIEMVVNALKKVDDKALQLQLAKDIGGKSASALPMLENDAFLKMTSNRITNPDAFETFGDNVYKFKESLKTDFAVGINKWIEGVNILYKMYELSKMNDDGKGGLLKKAFDNTLPGQINRIIKFAYGTDDKKSGISQITDTKSSGKSAYELELESDAKEEENERLKKIADEFKKLSVTDFDVKNQKLKELEEVNKKGMLSETEYLNAKKKLSGELSKMWMDELNKNGMYNKSKQEYISNFDTTNDEFMKQVEAKKKMNEDAQKEYQDFLKSENDKKTKYEEYMNSQNDMINSFQSELENSLINQAFTRNSGLGGSGSQSDMMVGQIDYSKVLQQKNNEQNMKMIQFLETIAKNTMQYQKSMVLV